MQALGLVIDRGLRKLTPAILAGAAAARGPLPTAACKATAVSAFKRAAPHLRIPGQVVLLVDYLAHLTSPTDWVAPARPLVWPSNEDLMHELGKGRSQIKALLNKAIELRLISPKPSANGKRFGSRNARGVIVEAYGFDLSPLAVRSDEFTKLAKQAKSLLREHQQLKRRATIARRQVTALITLATEHDIAGDWLEQLSAARELAAQARLSTQPLDRVRALVDQLEQLAHTLELDISGLIVLPTDQPHGAESPAPDTIDSIHKSLVGGTPAGLPTPNGMQMPAIQASPSSPMTAHPHVPAGMTPADVAAALPHLNDLETGAAPSSWPEIAANGRALVGRLGVPVETWSNALATLGPIGAAVAIGIIAGRPDIRSAACYLQTLADRHRAGALRLDMTLRKLTRRKSRFSAISAAGEDSRNTFTPRHLPWNFRRVQ